MKHLITILLIILTTIGYSQSKKEINEYYKEICYYTEWNGKTPPTRFYNDVKIYVGGEISDSLEIELHKIIKELNDLIIPINISVVKDSSESNVYLYCGSGKGFVNSLNESVYLKKWRLSAIEYNWGVFWIKSNNETIVSSKIFIDTKRTESIPQQ